jgi:hypothetical protein
MIMELGPIHFLAGPFVGLVLLGYGIAIRIGYSKKWFLRKPVAVYGPKNLEYAMIPLGLGWIILTGSLWISQMANNMVICVLAFLFLVVIAFIWFPPRWIKPQWVQKLEDSGYNIDLLRKEAHQFAKQGQRQMWLERVKAQKGIEEWAREVYDKRGLTPRPKPHKSTQN